MGLFDFWKKRAARRFSMSPEQMAELGLTEADLEAALEPSNQPRQHHYAFAHRVLPPLAFERTTWMMQLLRSEEADEFLVGLWNAVGNDLPAPKRLDPIGLSCQSSEHGDFVLALVTMPPVRATTEAHFVALAFGPLSGGGGGTSGPGPVDDLLQAKLTLGNNPASIGEDDIALQYFTLENGFVMPGEPPRTALCGWTAEPAHLNMGDGPPPEAEAFRAKVLELVRA